MSLTLGWFLGRAADLTNIKRGRYRDDAGVDFPINAEHPDQRAALLTSLDALGTEETLAGILGKLIAAPATADAQEAQRLLLAQIAASLTTEGGYLDGVEGLLNTIGTALAGTLKVQTPATAFVGVSVPSLSAAQAAGTASVVGANVNRRVIALTPASDGRLYIASATASGFYWPLYAGVTRVLSGADCPTNALFVTGQTVATALPMAEG